MIKKIIIGVIAVVVIVVLGGFMAFRSLIASMDQVTMQYDNEVISDYKQELSFSEFNEALANIDEERMHELESYIVEKSISSIRENLLNRNLKCEEIVLFYVNRIKENDSNYNAVIQLNPNALEYARSIDKKIENDEELNELDGVVVLIKDNVASKDMNTASGAYALKDLITTRDAFIVNSLTENGAIILGKANLSEWSNFMSQPSSSGFSVLGGQTKNAYGKYDVGGSSAGSSVATSLNYATITIGTETSGSLIYPAGQNSVVALKPTMGLLSRDLIVPISEAQDTAGLISKSVIDLRIVFKVMVKKDVNDQATDIIDRFDMTSLDSKLTADNLNGKKLGYVNNGSEEIKQIVEEFKSLGAEVIEVKFDDSINKIDMMNVLSYGIKNDVNAFLANDAVVSNMKNLRQIVEYNNEDESRMPFGQAYLQSGLDLELTTEAYEEIVINNRELASTAIDKVLSDHDIEAIISISNELSGIYAPAGYPAITIPSGYRESGEPYGLTLIGPENSDGLLIEFGYGYEVNTNHRQVPVLK